MKLLKKNKENIIVLLVLLLSGILRIQNLWFPIGADMHSFRQTETAIIIQSYFNDGWSLFHYEMPILGHPWKIPFEFPIYQSAVYFIMKALHKSNIDVWCRLVSLCSFYLSVLALKKVADLFVDKMNSYCICILYLFAPFTILWSRAALIDYMSVLFALLYVWGLCSWLIKGRRTYVFAFIFGTMAYLLKATTMFPYVFFLAYIIIDYFLKQIREQYKKITLKTIFSYVVKDELQIALLAVLCILPVVPGILWTRYADMVKLQSIYTQYLTSKTLHDWNYGTMEQKLQISNWAVILKRLVQYMGSGEIVCGIGLLYLWIGKKKNLNIIVNCGIAVFLTVFSLFNLYYIHDYYLIALTPILSIAYGSILFIVLEKLFVKKIAGKIMVGAILIFLVFAQVTNNREYLEYALSPNSGIDQSGNYLNAITEQDERIVIEGEDWNPTTLYYADRKGLMLTSPQKATEQHFTEFLQQENYTTLVTHSIEFVDIFAQYYDILVQYPYYGEKYIYKFYQQMPSTMNTQDDGIALIKIKYSPVAEPIEIGITLIDNMGNEFQDSINLLVNKEEIYYNVSALWENIENVSLDIPEDMEISIEY